MLDGWLELHWDLKKGATTKKRKTVRCAGPTARQWRRQASTGFDLATEAQAMLQASAFDAALEEGARASQRGAELQVIVQSLLLELQRAGGEAFMSDDDSCIVRSAHCKGGTSCPSCTPARRAPPARSHTARSHPVQAQLHRLQVKDIVLKAPSCGAPYLVGERDRCHQRRATLAKLLGEGGGIRAAAGRSFTRGRCLAPLRREWLLVKSSQWAVVQDTPIWECRCRRQSRRSALPLCPPTVSCTTTGVASPRHQLSRPPTQPLWESTSRFGHRWWRGACLWSPSPSAHSSGDWLSPESFRCSSTSVIIVSSFECSVAAMAVHGAASPCPLMVCSIASLRARRQLAARLRSSSMQAACLERSMASPASTASPSNQTSRRARSFSGAEKLELSNVKSECQPR